VQAVGRLPVDFSALGVASLSLAAHKLGGPRGIGGLLLRGDTAIEPLIPGTQERGLRGGTESVTLAVGFATAVRLATDRQAAEARRLAGLRDRLEQAVLAAGVEAVVIGGDAPRLPQMSVIAFPGRDRQAVVMAADLAGLCLASGTACASGSSEPSPALVAAGLPDAWVQSAVRVSLGWSTTDDDIERGIDLLRSVVGFRKP
jgi:cysteine desulfurase